jgi:hypothetical protein
MSARLKKKTWKTLDAATAAWSAVLSTAKFKAFWAAIVNFVIGEGGND